MSYWTIWLALALFAFANIGTPGPNNIMLITSGAHFGFYKTIPHMLGIANGIVLMLVIVATAQSLVTQAMPVITQVLKWISLAVIFWLAYKIATADAPFKSATHKKGKKPFTMLQAAAFQWINPKAWLLCLAASSQYFTPQLDFFPQLIGCVIIFWLVTMTTTPAWTYGGKFLHRFLKDSPRLQIFNITMAILLVISVLPGALA